MATFPSQPVFFYVHPNAITFGFNDLGDPDNLAVSVYSGAKVSAYIRDIDENDSLGITPANEYRQWTITAFSTHFTDSDGCPRYAHIAVSRTTGNATIVFPPYLLDVFGRPISDDAQFFLDEQGNPIDASDSEDPSTDGDYFFFFIGKITSSNAGTTPRGWDGIPTYGILDTARYHEEEQKGEWQKMFEYVHAPYEAIRTLLPFLTISIGKYAKRIIDLFRKSDQDSNFADNPEALEKALDEIIPTEAHMRDYGKQHYLSRTEPDTAQGHITFAEGATVQHGLQVKDNNPDTSTAILFGESVEKGTNGAAIWEEEGSWHAQFDYIRINKKATFEELEVQKMSHIGGAYIQSAASCTIHHTSLDDAANQDVPDGADTDTEATPDAPQDPDSTNVSAVLGRDPSPDAPQAPSPEAPQDPDTVRCYFLATDGDRAIQNQWKVGDQAICKTFNLVERADGSVSNHYWWRLVTAVGTTADGQYHYIDVSITDCDAGSDLPQAGDDVVLLGYRHADDPTRQNAIIQAGAGEGSPYSRYYKGINSYTLPKARLNLECDHPSIDVETLTITTSNGATKDAGSILSEGFQIYSLDVRSMADADGEPVSIVQLNRAGWPDTEEHWTAADYPGHATPGDIAITTDGIYYRFTLIEGSYAWQLITDVYLIQSIREAQEARQTADAALRDIADMADDNLITPDEKLRMRQRLVEMEQQYNQIINEAGFAQVSPVQFRNAYNSLVFFMDWIIGESGTTMLVNNSGDELGITRVAGAVGSGTTYEVAYHEPSAMPMFSSYTTYPDAVRNYHQQYHTLRRNITNGIYTYIEDIAIEGGFSADIANKVTAIYTTFAAYVQDQSSASPIYKGLTQMSDELSYLSNWVSETGVTKGSGVVTTANYASLFSAAIGQDGQTIAQALANTYVGIEYDRDENGNIILDENQQPVGKWISGFKIRATYIDIDTENFSVDSKTGDVRVSGNIKARNYIHEFVTVPKELFTDEACRNKVAKIDLLAMIRGEYYHKAEGGARRQFVVGDCRNFKFNVGCNINITAGEAIEAYCPTGTTILLYNASWRRENGYNTTFEYIGIESFETTPQGFEESRVFRGVSKSIKEKGTANAIPWGSFKPINRISFGNGIVELMSVPADYSGIDWCVTRISVNDYLLSEEG